MSGIDGHQEIVVIGGGLAGGSVACTLAQAGRPILMIERDPEPRHKVCGEFLSIEAQAYLAHLGIDLDSLGASRISVLRLIYGRNTAEVDLPFVARGLSRKILDEALLQQASLAGTRIVRGSSVRSFSSYEERIRVEAGSLGEVHSDTLFLATGKHDLRGAKRQPTGSIGDLIGFKMHYSLAEAQRCALEGAIEVLLFTGGYAGLQLIEDGVANLCLVVSQKQFEHVGKNWTSLLDHIAQECPLLGERLQGAVPLFDRPLSIFQIPYGFLHTPNPDEPQNLFRLGDQAGVIPSFTGDGMSIALHSGCLAAATFLAHGHASTMFHRRIQADIRRQVGLASGMNKVIRQAAGRTALFHLCRAWPSVMRHVAALTRVEEASMQRALGSS
jgi:flavin-dependent dehydrogenase